MFKKLYIKKAITQIHINIRRQLVVLYTKKWVSKKLESTCNIYNLLDSE